MFTGLVEELGEIQSITGNADGVRLKVRAGAVLDGARVGESIAVSGVCLTIVDLEGQSFAADVVAETLRRTTLGGLQPGDPVDLERPLRFDQRLGGHIVQGHVDGVGTITSIKPEGEGVWMEIAPPPALMRYLVEKGSVAVDGVSLTVAAITDAPGFAIALIPHTLAVTTLGRWGVGGRVNIEVDILAKHVEKLLEGVAGRWTT